MSLKLIIINNRDKEGDYMTKSVKNRLHVAGLTSFMATIATLVTMSMGNVSAAHNGMYQANLTELNGSGTSGTAMVKVDGDQATVTIKTSGASADLPHAQHIHIGGNNVCPTDADSGDDEYVSVVEGQPQYGEIKVSLTTEGDVSPDSGLAVDRFPVADADGMVTYERTFTLPEGVTDEDMENAVIVQHGISKLFDDESKYDGEMKSTISEDLPFEATVPSACGKLAAAPQGAANTGSGSTAGIENVTLLVAGSATMLTAGAALLATKR